MDESRYYFPEEVDKFATTLGVDVQDSFKYLINNYSIGDNSEDAKLVTPELIEAYRGLYENCQEFISTYRFYTTMYELTQKAIVDKKIDEIRSSMENTIEFLGEVAKESKRRREENTL